MGNEPEVYREAAPEPTSGDAAPFSSEPLQPGGKGCSRVALIGCAVVLVLVAIVALTFLVKADDFAEWAFRQIEPDLVSRLSEDVGEEERAELAAAFEEFRGALSSGAIDPAAARALQAELMELVRKPKGEIDADDVESLTAALRRAAESRAAPAP